jgi:predicted TIM-barrel fold metal-dependent hydrolase
MNELKDAPLCLPPHPLRNTTGIKLPTGTCDTHFHVFAEGAPLASPRSYTPRMQTTAGWLALAESFGIASGVLVQPSVYGLDNSVLLRALESHPQRLRGIVVTAPETSDDELRRLGWHVQFQVGPEAIDKVVELANRYELNGVIDHLAFMPLDPPGPALDALDRALGSGRVYTKISAPYRLRDSNGNGGYRQAVSRLARNHPERLLWASDWPHTELFDTVPQEDDLVALSLGALPVETHNAVFATNAKSLYFSH